MSPDHQIWGSRLKYEGSRLFYSGVLVSVPVLVRTPECYIGMYSHSYDSLDTVF